MCILTDWWKARDPMWNYCFLQFWQVCSNVKFREIFSWLKNSVKVSTKVSIKNFFRSIPNRSIWWTRTSAVLSKNLSFLPCVLRTANSDMTCQCHQRIWSHKIWLLLLLACFGINLSKVTCSVISVLKIIPILISNSVLET